MISEDDVEAHHDQRYQKQSLSLITLVELLFVKPYESRCHYVRLEVPFPYYGLDDKLTEALETSQTATSDLGSVYTQPFL